MNRKDFIKKSALALAVSSFATWELLASTNQYVDPRYENLKFFKLIALNGYDIYMGALFSVDSKKGDIISIDFSEKQPISKNVKWKFEYELLEDFKLGKKIKLKFLDNNMAHQKTLETHGVYYKYFFNIDDILITGLYTRTYYYGELQFNTVINDKLETMMVSMDPTKVEGENNTNETIQVAILANERSVFSDEKSNSDNSSETNSSQNRTVVKEYDFKSISGQKEDGNYEQVHISVKRSLKKGETISLLTYITTTDGSPKLEYNKKNILVKAIVTYELLEDFVLGNDISVKLKGEPTIEAVSDFNASSRSDLARILTTEYRFDEFRVTEYEDNDDISKKTIQNFRAYYAGKEKFAFNNTTDNYAGVPGFGCFLTSACVFNLGLPDDCKELSTLRDFRDNYMSDSLEGQLMIKDYYSVGPNIVNYIQKHEQKDKMYQFIYNNLVVPSIEMIENGENEKAMQYYAAFTNLLKQKCNV